MADLQNLQFTWHLVSQFVSWEFCRYMDEEKENHSSETDVLIFLRNMIVKRTEKAVSDITKHEIVAKFIMEIKSSQSISKLSSIEGLAESVKAIFPKLKMAVDKLVQNFKAFSNALETTDEGRKEIIWVRIDETINDFIKEANRLLSQPLLLQIVKPWKPKKKVYNHEIFENVLKCLCNDDPITRSEAKLIAIALNQDKDFEKILLKVQAERETDSAQLSVSHLSSRTSQNTYSQDFIKNSQSTNKQMDEVMYLSDSDFEVCKSQVSPSNLQPPNNSDQDLFNNKPPTPENHLSNLEFQSNFEPPDSPADSPIPDSPPRYPFIHRIDPSEIQKGIHGFGGFRDSLNSLRNAPSRLMDASGGLRNSPSKLSRAPVNNRHKNRRSSSNESNSDDLNSILENSISKKFKEIYDNQRFHKVLSDPDTSDCEKTEVLRFLTPTCFKKPTKKKMDKVLYLSDCESNDSSIRTIAAPDSQKNDPNWTYNEFTDGNHMMTKRKKKVQKSSIQQLDVHDTSLAAFHNICMPSTSAARSSPAKKKRVVILPRSPNMNDFVLPVRNPPGPPNTIPDHKASNTKSKKKQPPRSKKLKNQCQQCSSSYKTSLALRRHVFLKHTNNFSDTSDFEQ